MEELLVYGGLEMLQEEKIKENGEFVPYANPGKNVEVTAGGKRYMRHAIKIPFVEAGKENYIDILQKYALPLYKEGDLLSIGEKVISLCQNRVILKSDLKVGFWANFLSKFTYKSPYGFGIRNPLKMAAAIKLAGLPRVLFAAICSAVAKLFGIRGVFYKVVGHNVANIDGFNSLAFDYYSDKGMISPENPGAVCNEIKSKLGMNCMIVDANDIGVEILGVCSDVPYDIKTLEEMIKDNPAGQDQEMTPFILIREIK